MSMRADSAGTGSGPDVARLLPHRHPFLLVTRIVKHAAEEVWAEWDVGTGEWWSAGHFPGDPLVPGVLVGEAMAQAAGLVVALDPSAAPPHAHRPAGFLARMELRFHAPVRPPATIALQARRTTQLGTLHHFEAEAAAGGIRVASGSLVLSVPAAS